jgi:outer membrane protein OmpA-like peptidoglycan-associated protein
MSGTINDQERLRSRGCMVLSAIILLLAAAVFLQLHAKHRSDALPSPQDRGLAARSIVTLRDRSTMVAPEGTVGRDIADWLASNEPGSRYFELGGQQFVGDTSQPTEESEFRIDRLVAMLHANQDVSVQIVGFAQSAATPGESRRLSLDRARHVRDEIVKEGIAASRVTMEGRGDADPIAPNTTDEGRARNRRVAILVTRPAPA